MRRMMRQMRVAAMLMAAVQTIAACSGSERDPSPGPDPIPVVSVTVDTPPSAIVAGGTYTFTATVTGTMNTAVLWSVDASGNTNVGTINNGGMYTAPPSPGRFTVRATSVADPTKSGSAPVLVTAAPVSVTVTPASVSVGAAGSVQLTATVTGATNAAVTWDLPGGPSSGALASTGNTNTIYTAPATVGVYQVRATSVADPSKSVQAAITVAAGSGLRIAGANRVAPNTSTQLSASFNDAPTTVTWSIDGSAHGSTVSSSGLFTASDTLLPVVVRATDTNSRTTTATITVATQVLLDIIGLASPIITTADMLTFYWSVSPSGVSPDVTWNVSPADGGTVIPVDYFRGFVPSGTPGSVTITATTVADPSVSKSFTATVTAASNSTFPGTTGAPQSARYEHSAATLSDGRVVLIGGQRTRAMNSPLTSTEVFSPASGAFSVGPVLRMARVKSEAIAIDANRVLVTGGVEDYNLAYNSAEVVDVAGGTSTLTANTMNARRLLHQMAPITTGANAGRIAVLGGFNGPIPYGVPTWQSTASVELFDPATNRFNTYPATMRSARGQFTATPLQDGRILIVGGYDAATSTTLASAEIFDPVAGAFTFTGTMSRARTGHTATRLANGSVLIVGGTGNGTDHNSAELYNPATGQFESVGGPLTFARSNHAAALMSDGRVAIIGGESGNYIVRGSVEAYDPATRTFAMLGPMRAPRRRPTASVITSGANAGRVLVFGGGADDKVNLTAEIVR